MAKNKTSNQSAKAPQEDTVLSDESLEQVSGGTNDHQNNGKAKGKGKRGTSPQTGGINPVLGDGSVRTISDGTSNTITFGE